MAELNKYIFEFLVQITLNSKVECETYVDFFFFIFQSSRVKSLGDLNNSLSRQHEHLWGGTEPCMLMIWLLSSG